MEEIQCGLYLVATPIGNLDDISMRALNVLRSVDTIACEDTRHSLKLLNHYDIHKHLIAYHSYNEQHSADGIMNLIRSGKSVALITDCGTPCISDPGWVIVHKCVEEGIRVLAVPGAAAVITALIVSGFRTDKFAFIGFLSPKSGRRKNELERYKSFEGTIILYASPYQVAKVIKDIGEVYPDKQVCAVKELTKINEQKLIGSADEVFTQLGEPDKIRGEFVVMIGNY
ncbi:MAG: 16S rRNA (cytidine(1402)-2'-O)-methyltransferase [Spirochaetales bacterium]|nr:16S rRNA (cytidine(1402)-2'-O)-methyltransferase [Spirochaetales bacterium]MBR6200633.1 16S rRNA (cytidine(1402)-2'-O)-methyltransferase [Spirochaetales bacterium]